MINELMKKKIHKLYFSAGLTKTEISRRTGVSYKSILKIIDEYEMGITVKETRKPRPRASDVYEDEVREILQHDKELQRKQRHTAFQIYCELAKIHKDFRLSYASVLRLYNRVYAKVFDTNQLTDIDFVEPGTMYVGTHTIQISVNKRREDGCLLVCHFPYSGFTYYQVFRSDSQENVLTGIFNVYKHLGGIPPYQYYPDNLIFFDKPNSTNGRCRTRGIFTSFCLQNYFVRYYASDDQKKYRGHMSSRKNFFVKSIMQGRLFVDEDIKLFNERLLFQCNQLCDIYNQKRKMFKHDLLIEEKKLFNKIPDDDYEICEVGKKKAGHRAEVYLDYQVYIMPPDYHDLYVVYKMFSDRIVFENVNREFIVEYPRIYGEPGQVSIDWSTHLITLVLKPGAYSNIDINKHMSKNLDCFLRDATIQTRRYYFTVLRDIIDKASFKEGIKVLEALCEANATTERAITKIVKAAKYETTLR